MLKNVVPVPLHANFRPLFNGENFEEWYTYLESKGRNKDPDDVFSIEDNVIRISGREGGYLMTEDRFTNYHFKLEFKWGKKKWPPRLDDKRDSGICYHIPLDEPDKVWPQSVECQVQEGDVGDFWMLGQSTILVDGQQNEPGRHVHIPKKGDAEKPNGQWNTVEILSFNGQCIQIVNGTAVNSGQFSSLRKGKILLQSEFAEIYYRNINIRKL